MQESKVVVFESDNPTEIELIKSKLIAENIEADTQNSYMSFISTPTAANLKLRVSLKNEKKAFDIIDAYLQETDLDIKNPVGKS